MKSIYIKGLLSLLFLTKVVLGFGQVTGISYTLSPTAEYTWWDNKSGLNDGFLFGGKFGVGFGEYLELRGTYLQSISLKTNFAAYGIPNFSDDLFVARDVKLSRWGGELKANLSRGKLLPFFTIGTGVQSIQLDTFASNKHIFINLGAGIKLSAGDRYTFTLEAKNTPYNFNAVNNLLTPEDRTSFDIAENDFGINQLKNNWSLNAALQFYLGGRRPGELSELDKAYMSTFSEGLSGLRIPIEPTLTRVNFDKAMPFRDTWMFGVTAGLDFNAYVGLRGYYYQAMKDNKVSTNFDKLAMYGAELRLKLNASGGVAPYLIVGGGYLNVDQDKYIFSDSIGTKSQAFASGGVGLSIPFSDRFNIFGSAQAMLTSGSKAEDLQTVEEIQTSIMYRTGMRFIIGKKSNPADVFKSEVDAALLAQQTINNENTIKLKQEYESKLIELETNLNQAYADQDIEKAARILKEKETAEQVVKELEERVDEKNKAVTPTKPPLVPTINPSGSYIHLTPAEFESLIEEILENKNASPQPAASAAEQQLMSIQYLQYQALEQRIAALEKNLIGMDEHQSVRGEVATLKDSVKAEVLQRDLVKYSAKLLLEIQKINEKLEETNKDIKLLKDSAAEKANLNSQVQEPIQQQEETLEEKVDSLSSVTTGNVLGVKTGGDFINRDKGFASKLIYEGMSGFTGFNLGGQTTFNVGFRWHYGVGRSNFELMPEAFFGFGSPSAFGLTINGVYPIELRRMPFTPYLGAGAGFMQIAKNGDDRLRLNYNFIFGTYLKVLGGRLYVDFTARNLFDFNQVIAGYRFTF